ncbi:MAG: hypothetical protein P8X57_04765 [Cyclobacteriaceae bacterium]
MERWISLLIISISIRLTVSAQDRYVAYFSDKENNTYSLTSPDEFLSDRAIQRRIKAGIMYDESDLPVSSAYTDHLKANGINVFYTSKWLNAALLQIDAADSAWVAELEFVVGVERVADGEKFSSGSRKGAARATDPAMNPQANIAYTWHGIDRLHENRKRGEGVRIAVMDASFRNVNNLPASVGNGRKTGRFLYGDRPRR